MVKDAICKHFEIDTMATQQNDLVDQWLNDADADGDGHVSREEMKRFLMEAIKNGTFKGHFKKM